MIMHTPKHVARTLVTQNKKYICRLRPIRTDEGLQEESLTLDGR